MDRFAALRRAAGGVAAFAAVALGACAPIVSHGPRVRDGTTLGVNSGVNSNLQGEAMQVVVPYLTVGNDWGAGNGGRQFTIQAVLPADVFEGEGENQGFLYGVQGDYYVQSQTRGPVVSGYGVQMSLIQVMPYAQVGAYRDGVGVYTTQGFGSMGAWFGLAPEVLFWSPGGGVEYDVGGVTLRGSISTMVGLRTDRMERLDDVPIALSFAIEAGAPRRPRPGRAGR